ncbi:MAG: hypothetical protein ACOY3P_05225 [Planctomycetota bacterium]
MQKRTKYQERIIRNYYENLDQILVQRLGEMLTDLYLAEGQKRVKLWKRVGDAMLKLKVPKDRVEHIMATNNPALVADLLKELLARG